MRIGIVGLGKLGLPMAVYYAHRGHVVTGIDNSQRIIKMVKEGECPYCEPSLANLMASVNSKLRVTDDYSTARDTDITFVIVPTPSRGDNRFDSQYVLSAVNSLIAELKDKEQYHLLVITSTVMPGTMEKLVSPLLKDSNIGLCYNPEFIALGSVIRNMANPDAVLIGESDKKAGDILEQFHKATCENSPPICRMSLWNAEVAKLALNVYVTTKISLANCFAEICEKIPGGDIDKVTEFLGLDTRIGKKYLSGGLGFGGPCFPRDNRAFASVARELRVQHPIQEATVQFNKKHNTAIGLRALRILKGSKTVSVLGLTYKPDTNVVEESASLEIISYLLSHKIAVRVFDPAGMENARVTLGTRVDYCPDIPTCLHGSSLCIVATPWDDFKELSPETFIQYMRKPKILDCWRIYNLENFKGKGIEYHATGVNSIE